MRIRGINWQTWLGFLLSIFAFLSYPTVFAAWPVTRDFPWVNLLLFAVATVLLFFGIKRAFGPERRRLSKFGAPVLALMSLFAFGMFIMTAFIAARMLPESVGAPQIGQKAPYFTLTDSNGSQVSLSQLLSEPVAATGAAPKTVVLVFYRGYW